MTDVPETVTPAGDTPGGDPSGGAEGPAPSDSATPDYEPCGHPHAHGTCWFSQIADPCGYRCKWLIDQGQDAGR